MDVQRLIRAFIRAELNLQLVSHPNNTNETCAFGTMNCGRGDVGEPVPACKHRKIQLELLDHFDKKPMNIMMYFPFMTEVDKAYLTELEIIK